MDKFLFNDIQLTFDDVLLVPQHTRVQSRNQCNLESILSHNIPLKIPIVSAPMDSVTEDKMAIELARNGGVGFIHRYNTVNEQCQLVNSVKRAENTIIKDPYLIDQNFTIETLMKVVQKNNVYTYLVTDLSLEEQNMILCKDYIKNKQFFDNKQLLGIITHRDIDNVDIQCKVKDLMIKREHMIVYRIDQTQNSNEILDLLIKNKIEQVPIIDQNNIIKGISCKKNLLRLHHNKFINKSKNGNLIVGAAVGIQDEDLE